MKHAKKLMIEYLGPIHGFTKDVNVVRLANCIAKKAGTFPGTFEKGQAWSVIRTAYQEHRASVHLESQNQGKVVSLPFLLRKSRPSSKDFYLSDAWRKLRYLALRNTDGRCGCCGATSKDGIRLHVDHIKPRSRFPDLELDLNNLQVLCEDCNMGKGAWDQTDWRGSR